MPFALVRALRARFNLRHDMADPADILADVNRAVTFKGTNLWGLIFAILLACVGMNVDSVPAVFGAMLISPVMGPIVGIGLGIATLDLRLIRRGAKNLLLAAGISLLASTIYFFFTPIGDASAEILARTKPAAWDVAIALFGGAAGAVGLTRRSPGNVIIGVALATALLPPLCTAGFGVATGHWDFVLGALYLFLINCIFIILATFLVAGLLPFPRVAYDDAGQARRIRNTVWLLALLALVPSVYLAADIVQHSSFEHNAQRFVDEQFILPSSYVVTRRLNAEKKTINLLLAGQPLTPQQLRQARQRLPQYNLKGAQLVIRQGLSRLDSADARTLRSNLLEAIQTRNRQALASYEARLHQLQEQLPQPASAPMMPTALPPAGQVLREAQVEHSSLQQLTFSYSVRPALDSLRADTTVVVALRSRSRLPSAEQARLTQWLRLRLAPYPVQVLPTPEGK